MLICHCCGGQLAYLGCLGNLFWFRCTQCGLEASKDKVTLAEAEDFLREDEESC